MRPQAPHRLCFARDALTSRRVEALGLDQRERNIAIEARVVREVDALLAALAEEAPHDIATARKGRGLLE
jgi:hypothetical protein